METAHNKSKILGAPCFAFECDSVTDGHFFFAHIKNTSVSQMLLWSDSRVLVTSWPRVWNRRGGFWPPVLHSVMLKFFFFFLSLLFSTVLLQGNCASPAHFLLSPVEPQAQMLRLHAHSRKTRTGAGGFSDENFRPFKTQTSGGHRKPECHHGLWMSARPPREAWSCGQCAVQVSLAVWGLRASLQPCKRKCIVHWGDFLWQENKCTLRFVELAGATRHEASVLLNC